jgi:hypothetical protein
MRRFLSNVVLFCSGVNTKFLNENCPEERHKFYPIGLGVIVTTTLAFISMMFAGNSIFGTDSTLSWIYIFLFSIFWAFAIFMIDWGLVKTMSKPDFSTFSLWDRIKYVFPVLFRVLVALIISFSVSRPLEVKIYEKRLRGQIEKDRLEYISREQKIKKDENEKTYGSSLNKANKTLLEVNDKISKGPENEGYKINLEEFKKCKSEYESLKATNERKISQLPTYIDKRIKDRNGDYRTIKVYNQQITRLRAEINSKSNQCSQIGEKVSDAETQFRDGFKTVQENVATEQQSLASLLAQQRNRDSLDLITITKASYVSFDTIQPGLITQLESMSNYEKTPEGQSAGWVRIILLLVIICIDTAPIVIKLLTKRGNYEIMSENETNKLNFLSTQENISNKHLIKELSIAQREVLNKAIEEWKNQELSDNNISNNYINRRT